MGTDWKVTGAALAGAVYAIGLVCVQAHLMRFGILDLSLLELRYLIVGGWCLLTVTPTFVFVVLTELLLTRRLTRSTYALLNCVVLIILVIAAAWMWRFPAVAQVFDFSFYIYPRWYIASNALWANLSLLITWVGLVLMRRIGVSPHNTLWFGTTIVSLLVFSYAVFFGRTVFPALSRGVGGGAPQLAKIVVLGKEYQCIVIHESAQALYALPLGQPVTTKRDGYKQLAQDPGSPVRQALARNEIVLTPLSKLESATFYGVDQGPTISRYLDEGRHLLP